MIFVFFDGTCPFSYSEYENDGWTIFLFPINEKEEHFIVYVLLRLAGAPTLLDTTVPAMSELSKAPTAVKKI